MTPNTQATNHLIAHGTFHQTAAQIAAPGSDTSAHAVTTASPQYAAPSQEHPARQSSWHTPTGIQRRVVVSVRRLSRTAGRVVYGGTHRGASVGVRRFVGVLALCVAGLGVAACAPTTSGTEAISGAQSTVERQMSGEYILNPDGTLSKIPVYVHEPELQSNAYTYSAFGAEQAAKHYLALVAYGWETGDTQPMKDFATDECVACSAMAAHIDDLYASGGWAHGTEYRVTKVDASEEVFDVEGVENTFIVILQIETHVSDEYKEGVLTPSEVHAEHLGMFLTWGDNSWKVTGISTLDRGQSDNG